MHAITYTIFCETNVRIKFLLHFLKPYAIEIRINFVHTNSITIYNHEIFTNVYDRIYVLTFSNHFPVFSAESDLHTQFYALLRST